MQVVNDSVNATKSLKKKWARAVVNGLFERVFAGGGRSSRKLD